MASQAPGAQLDILEQVVNDVLIQAGKALKSGRGDGRRIGSTGNISRISEAHVTFNSALDDLESELTRAKAVLQRDLDQLRAKRRPVVIPEPVMIPRAGAGPSAGIPAAPEPAMLSAPVPASAPPTVPAPAMTMAMKPSAPEAAAATARGLSASTLAGARPAPVQAPKPAPFPNMGIDPLPPAPSPGAGIPKANMDARGPQSSAAKPVVQAAKITVKAGGSPALKTAASPALKTAAPPAANTGPAASLPATKPTSTMPKTGSPGVKKSPSPAVKAASPVPASAKATVAKPGAATGQKINQATDTKAGPEAVPAPAVTPAPGPGQPAQQPRPSSPSQPAAGAVPQDPLTSLFGAPGEAHGSVAGALAAAPAAMNPEMNFTDMQFSLAPAGSKAQSLPLPQQAQMQGILADSDFDLTAFVADATNNILSDSFGEHHGPGQAGSGAGHISGGLSPSKVDADAAIEDLFSMDGPGMEMDLDAAGAVAAGDGDFNEFFLDGDASMGEFDNAYFGL